MFVKFLWLFILISAFSVSEFSQDQWFNNLRKQHWLDPIRPIELLKTDKTDVERIFGKPEQFDFVTANVIEYYTVKDGRATIRFTTTECTTKKGNKIKKGVVEELAFKPSNSIKFSELHLPLSKFKKNIEEDAPSIEIYSNEYYGVKITVQNGLVYKIRFELPQNIHVTCKEK